MENFTAHQESTEINPTLPYILHVHKEELCRKDRNHLRLCSAKIFLTDKLISDIVPKLLHCSDEEFVCLSREKLYKKMITDQFYSMQYQQRQGVQNPKPERVKLLGAALNCPFDISDLGGY